MPGRGAGESDWFRRNVRSFQKKLDIRYDIRTELRNWDREFPYFPHEIIVRYAAGFVASAVAIAVWGQLRSLFGTTKGFQMSIILAK